MIERKLSVTSESQISDLITREELIEIITALNTGQWEKGKEPHVRLKEIIQHRIGNNEENIPKACKKEVDAFGEYADGNTEKETDISISSDFSNSDKGTEGKVDSMYALIRTLSDALKIEEHNALLYYVPKYTFKIQLEVSEKGKEEVQETSEQLTKLVGLYNEVVENYYNPPQVLKDIEFYHNKFNKAQIAVEKLDRIAENNSKSMSGNVDSQISKELGEKIKKYKDYLNKMKDLSEIEFCTEEFKDLAGKVEQELNDLVLPNFDKTFADEKEITLADQFTRLSKTLQALIDKNGNTELKLTPINRGIEEIVLEEIKKDLAPQNNNHPLKNNVRSTMLTHAVCSLVALGLYGVLNNYGYMNQVNKVAHTSLNKVTDWVSGTSVYNFGSQVCETVASCLSAMVNMVWSSRG